MFSRLTWTWGGSPRSTDTKKKRYERILRIVGTPCQFYPLAAEISTKRPCAVSPPNGWACDMKVETCTEPEENRKFLCVPIRQTDVARPSGWQVVAQTFSLPGRESSRPKVPAGVPDPDGTPAGRGPAPLAKFAAVPELGGVVRGG
jgi:hypothetical protein